MRLTRGSEELHFYGFAPALRFESLRTVCAMFVPQNRRSTGGTSLACYFPAFTR